MAASPPLRSLIFPPEILLHILSFASNSYSGEHYTVLNERNADLARLARVSRAFQEGTYSVLYGDLRVVWFADKVKKLQKAFKANAHLLPIVRRLEATAVDEFDWRQYHIDGPRDDARSKEAWLKAYCKQKEIKKDSQEWLLIMEGGNHEAEGEWDMVLLHDAGYAWNKNAHGAWKGKGKGNPEGARELLDIVASAPALRSVVVREFAEKLDATDIATRGPYPLIESLEAPVNTDSETPSSPFFANHSLPSFLASSSPNLRSLSGHRTPGSRKVPVISLPPSVTRLEIIGFNGKDARIDNLLLQVQPSLKSLTLHPARASQDWPSSQAITSLLSSLETLVVIDEKVLTYQAGMDALILAIAPSSLRHLELIPATATLIAALPPSLQSIALLPATPLAGSLPEMERVLELMKAANTQPLRVEFATAFEGQGWPRWEECRDAYAAEGHTLSARSYYY
ncbi:hypothetical protein RQP46_004188 [Phenoliferia psychrophenolica]